MAEHRVTSFTLLYVKCYRFNKRDESHQRLVRRVLLDLRCFLVDQIARFRAVAGVRQESRHQTSSTLNR